MSEIGRVSTWAPLRHSTFRMIWLTQLGANIGIWMQTIAAQWMLVDEPNAATLVSLVQTATTLPFLVLGLVSGVLADIFDRRRYLLGLHLAMVVVAGSMAALAAADRLPPVMLLTLLFLLGMGTALAAPAWQATTPTLIPRALIQEASALGGMNQNLARIVGPAVAGVLIGSLGTAAVFAINALSLVVAAVVLLRWRSAPVDAAAAALERERLGAAMAAGTRFVRNAPMARRLLLRLIIFVVPATVLWALLPLVASERLGLGSRGYGLLLACVGVGAILGAVVLSWLRRHLPSRVLLGGAGAAYAISLVITGLSENPLVVGVFLFPVGLAWLTTMVSIMGTVQQLLPGWVRARGLSIFQLVFMGGQAVAALGWGLLAEAVGLTPTFLAGAALLALSSLSVLWWPLPDPRGMERKPAEVPLPELAFAPDPGDGPVMIMTQYAVRPENVGAFVAAMDRVERVRRRTGAITWHLYRDGEDLARFVEVYTVRTWAEHMQQHHRRVTGHDRLLMMQARELAETPPVVAHLFSAESRSLAET